MKLRLARLSRNLRGFSTKAQKFKYDIEGLYGKNYNNISLLPIPALSDTLASYA